MKMPADIQKLFLDFEQSMLKSTAEDDRKNKRYSSTIFENGIGARYWELKFKSKRVQYCYSSKANAAGCYLSWRCTIIGRRAKQTDIKPHDTRREAKAWALQDYRDHKPKPEGAS